MKGKQFALIGVSILLGVLLSTQYKSNQLFEHAAMNLRSEDLYKQLMEVERENLQLKRDLQGIREDGYEEKAALEIKNLKYLAGRTAVEGPGVLIVIEDSHQPLKMGENQNLYIVHDEDILKVINELRAAGAEAISINDQRLIGTSEIRCAGPTITVNGKLFGPPFQVKAIGDPKLMVAALKMRGGIVDTLKYWGIDLHVEEQNHLRIEAYSGPVRDDFAVPVTEEVQS
ncbi:MAG: DUF881 domain-containing protein [Veillonellaceae bacterium]|nr:DUF881 domain-containing protein [Veillonellaceae bacterium]